MSTPDTITVTVPTFRILIVEDQPGSALILQRGVIAAAARRRVDARIIVTHTAAAAVEQVEANPPDVVLLDLVLLDGGKGEDVLRHIRSAGRPCRVIVLSGLDAEFPLDAARLEALYGPDLRPDAFLSKPTSPTVIGAHLFAALEDKP